MIPAHAAFLLLQMQYSRSDGGVAPRYDEGEDMVRQLQANQTGVDAKLHQSQIQLFKDRQLIHSGDDLVPTDAQEEEEAGDSSDAEESGSEGSESDAHESSDEEEEETDDEKDTRGAAARSVKDMPEEEIVVCAAESLQPSLVLHCMLSAL